MYKFIATLLIVLLSTCLFISDTYAKRFGGGRSFGMSRSINSAPNHTNFSRAQTAPNPSGANKWLGPLAGLAIGGALASLFMGHNLGGGLFTLIIAFGIILVLIRFLKNRAQLRPYSRNSQSFNSFEPNAHQPSQPFSAANYSNTYQNKVSFDEASFLRQAKAIFIRLQAAYDHGNLTDIREFTTPEVFAEIQLQLHERGGELNQTEVSKVDAELLDLANEGANMIASVQFDARIREQKEGVFETVKEVWHIIIENNSKLLVAGIQQ